MLAPGLTVRRLVTRGPVPDPLAARLHCERALAVHSWQPTGLADSAILCVRRLQGRGGFEEMETRSLADALTRLAAQACQPARGSVPLQAPAVLFGDAAELLVCLARDWLASELGERWWWRALFPGLGGAEIVRAAWCEHARCVPAALDRLHGATPGPSEAERFLAEAPTGLVPELAARVAYWFGATEALQWARAAQAGRLGEPAERGGQQSGGGPSAVDAETDAGGASPGLSWLPLQTALPAEAAALLIVGLLLRRAPGLAQSRHFYQELRRWTPSGCAYVNSLGPGQRGTEEARTAPRRGAADDRELRLTHDHVARPAVVSPAAANLDVVITERAPIASDARAVKPPAARIPEPPEVTQAHRARAPVGNADRHRATRRPTPRPVELTEAGPRPSATSGDDRSSVVFPQPTETTDGGGEGPAAVGPLAEQQSGMPDRTRTIDSPTPRASPIPEAKSSLLGNEERALTEQVPTNRGGVFYLTNLALALELYGDFTSPRRPGLRLPLWDFLALVGRRMAGAEFVADPLWGLLARLSGRGESEAPGLWFEPPEEWRMPTSWLLPFPERDGWTAECNGDRRRLIHPAGFVVLDVPASGATPARWWPELAARYELDLKSLGVVPVGETVSRSREPLERWLDWLVPYLEARLGRALGVSDAGETRRLVLDHKARVEVTTDCLAVHFQLAEHPIALRCAGLDRDPGWVPAAGRRILFYYE